mgnify:CR=1 FL=1
MKKYILSICTLAAVCLGSVAVTSCSEPDDINDLVLNRVLSPTGITARISQEVNIIVIILHFHNNLLLKRMLKNSILLVAAIYSDI